MVVSYVLDQYLNEEQSLLVLSITA